MPDCGVGSRRIVGRGAIRGMIWRGASGVRLRTGGVGGRSWRRGWRAVVGGVDSREAEVGAGAVYVERLIVSR
jgi:hypothetical protein